jgi:hypothetical protein
MALRLAFTLLIIFITPLTQAGIFGPANYEECVLEKMKGQATQLLYTAQQACLIKFPPTPVETIIPDYLFKYDWCESNLTSQKICVSDLPKNISLTKAIATFYGDKCEVRNEKNSITLTTKKNLFNNNFEFGTSRTAYQCMTVTFFGFQK